MTGEEDDSQRTTKIVRSRDFPGRLWQYRSMGVLELQYDENDASYLRTRVDWCPFGAFQQFMEGTTERSKQAFLVDTSVDLEKVAAVAWSGDILQWRELLVAGIVRFLVDRPPRGVYCRIVHVSAVYLIQIAD